MACLPWFGQILTGTLPAFLSLVGEVVVQKILALILAAVALPTVAQAQPHPPECIGDLSRLGAPPRAAPAEDVYPVERFEGPARLDTAMDQTLVRAQTAMHPLSLGAAVLDADGLWTGRVGPQTAPLYWWASAGKLAVAVAVLQLVEEGRLSLDDPASRWVPGVPFGDRTTIRMLLDHTSGLYSANEAEDVRSDPRHRDLQELMAVASREGNLFCPGQAWRYSNTNYWVLAGVLEAIEGEPLPAILTRRIVERADLSGIRFIAADDPLTDMEPLGPVEAGGNEVAAHPAWVGGAGPMLATPEGATRFLQAVLTGSLLAPATVRAMLAQSWRMFDEPMYYGLGLMLYEPPGRQPGMVWIGHSGGAPGVKAAVVWSPTDQAYAAVALTGPGSAEAVANALLATRGRRRN